MGTRTIHNLNTPFERQTFTIAIQEKFIKLCSLQEIKPPYNLRNEKRKSFLDLFHENKI